MASTVEKRHGNVGILLPHEAFVAGVRKSGAPKEVVWIMDYLFTTVLDGRNAYLADGIQRALGRPPKDFAAYARDAAATGIWKMAECLAQGIK